MFNYLVQKARRTFLEAGCEEIFTYINTDYDHSKLNESYTVKGFDCKNNKLYLQNIQQDIDGNTYADEMKILPMPIEFKIDYFEKEAKNLLPALDLLINELKAQKPSIFKQNKTPYNRLIKLRGLINNALEKSRYSR